LCVSEFFISTSCFSVNRSDYINRFLQALKFGSKGDPHNPGSISHERREGKDQCNDRTGNIQNQSERCGDFVDVASQGASGKQAAQESPSEPYPWDEPHDIERERVGLEVQEVHDAQQIETCDHQQRDQSFRHAFTSLLTT
jgi:hypothetical protein